MEEALRRTPAPGLKPIPKQTHNEERLAAEAVIDWYFDHFMPHGAALDEALDKAKSFHGGQQVLAHVLIESHMGLLQGIAKNQGVGVAVLPRAIGKRNEQYFVRKMYNKGYKTKLIREQDVAEAFSEEEAKKTGEMWCFTTKKNPWDPLEQTKRNIANNIAWKKANNPEPAEPDAVSDTEDTLTEEPRIEEVSSTEQ